jgi:Zn-dependent protease with chaperone function
VTNPFIITGYLYPENSSARYRAELLTRGSHFKLHIVDEDNPHLMGQFSQLNISSRVGSIPRRIRFPDGWELETHNNDAVDSWIGECGQSKSALIIHTLETNLKWILASLVLSVLSVVLFIAWGIPTISHIAAQQIPDSVAEFIGEQTLNSLDEFALGTSETPIETQLEVQRYFKDTLADRYTGTLDLRLHFRAFGMSEEPVANAFALPSGDIILTDELVRRLETKEKIGSVILHEIGHVEERHGLEQVIAASGLTMVTLAIFGGDLSFGQEILVGFPAFLLQQDYSRGAEEEADTYALENMVALDIPTSEFADALSLIAPEGYEQNNNEETLSEESLSNWLSSHPEMHQRIEHARHYDEGHR